jgi:CheY-like chemotaxis protein
MGRSTRPALFLGMPARIGLRARLRKAADSSLFQPVKAGLGSQAMRWIGESKRYRPPATAASPLIAIVDDDPWSRDGLNCYLGSCGYNCAAFCTAEEYLSANAARETACLVADVQLPGMKGPELQERLLADGYRIPIIFVTGYFDEKTRDRVLRAGAIAYLTKPWCERALSGYLEKAFGALDHGGSR